MVFSHAKEHEVLGVFPIGIAEFPERPAKGVEPAGSHVHRTEPAVRREVWRAKLHGPEAGQRLRLIATREEGEFLGVGLAHVAQPASGDLQRFFPSDLFELARATRADPLQWRVEAGRGVVLHDPCGTLAAEDALVHRVVAVSFDIADLAVFQMHVDPAAAGTHVAGRLLHLVADGGVQCDFGLGHVFTCAPVMAIML